MIEQHKNIRVAPRETVSAPHPEHGEALINLSRESFNLRGRSCGALEDFLAARVLPPEEMLALRNLRPHETRYSVIVPAWNEEKRLPGTLMEMIDFFDRRREPYEIIVVDDGSRDMTAAVAGRFSTIRPQVKVEVLPENRGKGCAVRTGALLAHGRYVMFADADGSTPIDQFDRLKARIDAGALISIGSRAMHSDDTLVKARLHRKVLGRAFNYCVNALLVPGIADTQCGFKMFTYEAARFVFSLQQADRFSLDPEILFIARKAKLPVSEVPINWENVAGSKVNLVVDAAKMFKDIFVFRVRHHKVSPRAYQEFLEKLRQEARRALSESGSETRFVMPA